MTRKTDNHKEMAIRGLTQVQVVLRRFIMSVVLDYDAMEEILQETNLALWDKITKYDPNLPFTPWALRFARLQILAYRKRNAGKRFVILENKTIEDLAAESVEHIPEEDTRLAYLGLCIEELSPQHRDLLRERYGERLSLSEIGIRLNRSEGAMQQLFFRIRKQLRHCIEQKTQVEELA